MDAAAPLMGAVALLIGAVALLIGAVALLIGAVALCEYFCSTRFSRHVARFPAHEACVNGCEHQSRHCSDLLFAPTRRLTYCCLPLTPLCCERLLLGGFRTG
jgi:hypothetical protein